jgi:hypothetical protein
MLKPFFECEGKDFMRPKREIGVAFTISIKDE